MKLTGSHLAFEELAAVYAAMGDTRRAELAGNQAKFKKQRLRGV